MIDHWIQFHGETLIILGSLVGLLVIGWRQWLKFLARWEAMNAVIKSQLTTNGGGSLLDKVNQIVTLKSNVKEIQSLINSIRREAQDNNRDAQSHWDELANSDVTINKRLDAIDALREQLARDVPAALSVQAKLVVDVGVLQTDVSMIHASIQALVDRISALEANGGHTKQ